MNATTQLKTLSNKIADAIVHLVDVTDGPVTLSHIDREVAGFAKHTDPGWSFVLPRAGAEDFIWGGMSEAGQAALISIIRSRRVALQFVTALPYIIDGGVGYFEREDWQPVMLVPADGANLSVANWLARLSPKHLDSYIAGKAAHPNAEVRLLTPRPLSRAADYFSLGDPRNEFCALLLREQPPSSLPIIC